MLRRSNSNVKIATVNQCYDDIRVFVDIFGRSSASLCKKESNGRVYSVCEEGERQSALSVVHVVLRKTLVVVDIDLGPTRVVT